MNSNVGDDDVQQIIWQESPRSDAVFSLFSISLFTDLVRIVAPFVSCTLVSWRHKTDRGGFEEP